MKKQGGQTALTVSEENMLIERILLCAEWGFPLDQYGVRLLVKGYLDRRGKKLRDLAVKTCLAKSGPLVL